MSQETCLYLRALTLTQLYLMNRNLFQPFDWPLTNGFCTISWIHLKVNSVATYLMKRMKLIDLGQLPRALVKWSHPLISPQLGPAALNTLVHDHLTTKNKDRKITSHVTPHNLSHYYCTSLKCWIFISDRAILNYKKFHQWIWYNIGL